MWKNCWPLYTVPHDQKNHELCMRGQWTKQIFFCFSHTFGWFSTIAWHYRTNPWSAVPDWRWCRNADAGLTRQTNGKTNDAGLTFTAAFRYSAFILLTSWKTASMSCTASASHSFFFNFYVLYLNFISLLKISSRLTKNTAGL
jgi:hypothetical protein